VNLSKNS